jgi:hypothetical protein
MQLKKNNNKFNKKKLYVPFALIKVRVTFLKFAWNAQIMWYAENVLIW